MFSLFKKETPADTTGSNLIETLERYAEQRALLTFENETLFHHQIRSSVPFMLFDPYRGLTLFDRVSWDYAFLKNASAQPASNNPSDPRSIEVDEHQAFVLKRFHEILHNDGCPRRSMLMMEKLESHEFEALDESIKALLPEGLVLFADDDEARIEAKLAEALPRQTQRIDAAQIVGALFPYYVLLTENAEDPIALLTPEQRDYVRADLNVQNRLCGPYGSGKSTLILLKALFEKLHRPGRSVLIVEPTLAACERLKSQLLDIIEYAIIEFDVNDIEIKTPQQLLYAHASTVYKKEPLLPVQITSKMLKRAYRAYDIIFCDDAYAYDEAFVDYLEQMQHNGRLQLIDIAPREDHAQGFVLTHGFRSPASFAEACSEGRFDPGGADRSPALQRREGNSYLQTMLRLKAIRAQTPDAKVLIVAPDRAYARALLTEIEGYFGPVASLFNAERNLVYQDVEHSFIALENELSGLQCDHVIVSGVSPDSPYLCYAIHRARESATVITDSPEGD